MDFIRAAIKGLFYNYPIDCAAECITQSNEGSFMSGLKEVLRWDNPQFTTTEIGVLERVITQTWMMPYKRSFEIDGMPFAGRTLFLLYHLGSEVFDSSSWYHPTLQYDHLLRWREIVSFVGEDMLTTPFLAELDSVRLFDRHFFAWENVIRHNNKTLNRILDGGLSEVHSHINAATDVFELNWLRLMNGVRCDMTHYTQEKKKQKSLNDFRQDYSLSLWNSGVSLSLYDWGVVAAAIRTELYRVVVRGESLTSSDMAMLDNIILDRTRLYEQENEIIATIGSFENEAYRLPNSFVFDYALTKSSAKMCTVEERRQPYFIHHGEREMLYRFFRLLIENVGRASFFSPYIYLYLLIKNHFRREFVQTNPLIGFENFQRYQKRKGLYLDKNEVNSSVNFRYAVQTSLRDINNEKLETRMAPEQVSKRQTTDFKRSVFENSLFYRHPIKEDDLTFVVHFIKRPDNSLMDDGIRHASYRVYLQNQMQHVVSLCKEPPEGSDLKRIRIVGIDAAGAELDCRPEVFAPSFRYAQLCGLNNITYHAGEDFYDLMDGLRTIDEVLVFMNYQRGCRIGHALALGIQPSVYYESRHRNVIMPRQVMLDNLVWLFYKARQMDVELKPATLDFIDNYAHVLYQQIGYEGEFDIFIYRQSMLLRGDNPDEARLGPQELTPLQRAAKCHNPLCDAARLVPRSKALRDQYECNKRVKIQGSQPCLFVLPESIAWDIEAMQERMMDEIERKGIYIECNPSSNLLIGPFERYDDLPLWRFHNVETPALHSINVSINTDDKGVFSTSLYNEYSLISLAMIKRRDIAGKPVWSPKQVMDYIERLVAMSHIQRFEPVKVWLAE